MADAVARAHGQNALSIVLAVMLLAVSAFGLDPSLDISQYAHTSWKIRNGFTRGYAYAIAQTPDGYLWLGTELGLDRFDGVRVVPWQLPDRQQLPSNEIRSLLVARDGTLWIGTGKGLASWKNGQFTTYSELSGKSIRTLFQDREDTVWAGTAEPPSASRLCAIRTGGVQCQGGDGRFGPGIFKPYQDSEGNFWFCAGDGFWRWKPERSEFFATKEHITGGFAQDDQSNLLIGTEMGLRRFVNGGLEPYSLPGMPARFGVVRLRRDHEGGLWIGTGDRGLLHIHGGKADTFSEADGLSGDDVLNFFEDREGNMWVCTSNGLDRFRDYAVPNISIKQGLSNTVALSVLASKDGDIWIATSNGLNRWHDGQISVLLHGFYNTLFQDSSGRIWASGNGKFGYLNNNQLVPMPDFPGRVMYSTTEAPSGDLWVVNQDFGLFHLRREQIVQQVPWAGMGHKDPAFVVAADPSQKGVWLGFSQGGVSYFADGGVKNSFSAAQGLGQGQVRGLRFGPRGALWVATEGGLSRIKDGQISTLTSKNGLPCDTVHWSMEDDDHSIWLYMACGLVRISRSDMDAWVKNPTTAVKISVFDVSDGVQSHAFAPTQGVSKSADGKIWFVAFDGISVIDPYRLAFNKLPPPIHIEQITADRKNYDLTSNADGQVRLPPRIRDLEIDYTALSLVVPEKVLFRYKLEGWESEWQDAGTRRQAFYSNLPPRKYTFRVMACNNSGVWNEAGTSLNFSVAPAYYQTLWFRSLCVLAFLGLLAALYQWRLRQVARMFNMRAEERVNERTRVARDLHDTLLQSFQGVLLKFHAVTYLLPEDAEARKNLEGVIEQARQAITEGRDTVYGLRSSTVVTNELAPALSTLGEELAASQTNGDRADFRVHVEGTPRNLSPIVRDEVYRIACEALRNAFKHAQARQIELELRYDRRQFRLLVRDDGKGIDQKVLTGDGLPGHYGLPGMHERAQQIGGKLAVWSKVNSGTEAELTIPASVAYKKSPAGRRPMFFRRGA